ncbi:nitroreductase family protein [Paenibacillus alkalitolerans]|uniref:nitroreductase family protein n=1 Tax=Paenibacillus alkalitolerans TaxID=2799335 RepID=UPI0018F662E3|nr:nitroreductase [Paenibacillus alkalitolerans]
MNLIDVIRTRRSIGRVKEDDIDRGVIQQLLDAAVCAPNHKRTVPWKFFVMAGKGRSRLGHAYAEIYRADHPDADEAALEKQRAKAYRAPVVIAAACVPSKAASVIELEEYAAVYAAIQNLLLAAHSLGLGAIWRTGEPAYSTLMNQAFGLDSRAKVLGLIYIGIPDMEPPRISCTPAAEKTVWIEEE